MTTAVTSDNFGTCRLTRLRAKADEAEMLAFAVAAHHNHDKYNEPGDRSTSANNKGEGSDGNNLRLVVLFQRVGPYHFARLRAAGQHMRVTVIEYSNVDPFYAWDEVAGQEGFERVILFKDVPVEQQPAEIIVARVRAVLSELRPQVVFIPGWSDRVAFAVLSWCVRHGVPAGTMSESTEGDETRVTWKEWVKRRVVRMFSAALVGGTPHRDYMMKLGMPSERIFLGYDAVDNRYFSAKAEQVRDAKREAPSTLPSAPFFLASARFIEKKNLPGLLQAYALYRKKSEVGSRESEGGKSKIENRKSETWDLVLIGDGELRSALCALRSALGLDACVHLPGFKQYPELPAYYGLAGAFIHASTTEQWGLVVNEAMASGLPVLVSNRCGCATDLVRENVNGFTFDPCNVEQLAQLMLRISDSHFPISDFGAASARIIADWGPDRFAHGLKCAAENALASKPMQSGLFDWFCLSICLRRANNGS